MRNGLIAGVLIAAIAALLSVMWFVQVSTLAVQQLSWQMSGTLTTLTNSAMVSLGKADEATEMAKRLTNDQRRLLDVSTGSVARLIQHTDASLNCNVVGRMGHGKDTFDCQQLGVLVRASMLVSNEDKRMDAFGVALQKAVESLGASSDKLGKVLDDADIPRILKALTEAAEHFDGTTIHLEGMSAEGQRGMAEVAGMLHDLRYPQKPSKFMSALNMALRLLGVAYQSRGALGK